MGGLADRESFAAKNAVGLSDWLALLLMSILPRSSANFSALSAEANGASLREGKVAFAFARIVAARIVPSLENRHFGRWWTIQGQIALLGCMSYGCVMVEFAIYAVSLFYGRSTSRGIGTHRQGIM